jgi:hypothetical protein
VVVTDEVEIDEDPWLEVDEIDNDTVPEDGVKSIVDEVEVGIDKEEELEMDAAVDFEIEDTAADGAVGEVERMLDVPVFEVRIWADTDVNIKIGLDFPEERVVVWVEVKAAELPRDELDRGTGLDIESTEFRADLVGQTVFLEPIEGATKIVVTVVDGRVETKGDRAWCRHHG